MSKQKPTAFQFYVKDYLSGAARRMTLPAPGAYLNLLCTAWDSDPTATLPDDPEKLRRFAGASAEEWLPIKDEAMENFVAFDGAPNRIVNNVFASNGRSLLNTTISSLRPHQSVARRARRSVGSTRMFQHLQTQKALTPSNTNQWTSTRMRHSHDGCPMALR
jgi:uncharacterized protein YdaU (DUF1376 family)